MPEIARKVHPTRVTLRGTVIAGRYQLDRRIGEGGMATVWAATHLTLDQQVALKFIEVGGPRREAVYERFLREARIAAAVRHRNVVDIIDFGTSDDGTPYMAMELLVGHTLGQRIEDASDPIPVHDAVKIMARVLSGLGAVHDAGLVHRDVKPENIFLVEDADGVYPKLLDFGVSRAIDSDSKIKSVIPTVENAIVGTPQYMSPEQARGLASIDHRSDLWSAGVILFELLTGTLPFDAVAIGDVIIKIATQEPPAFESFRPDLAGPIGEVIHRALSKAPADRFRSAREMRTMLLTAVAQVAVELHGSVNRFDPDTYDTPGAADLLEAVGDAREPGDSSVIDFTEHLHLIESMKPPPMAREDLPTVADSRLPPIPPAPKLPRSVQPAKASRAPLVAIGVLVVVGGLAITAGVLLGGDETSAPPRVEPEAPSAPEVPAERAQEVPPEALPAAPPEMGTVAVTLQAVPEGAEILLDGVAWFGGPELELPGDSAAHTIEVRAGDGRVWSQVHTADRDGSYSVVLPPRARRRSRRRASTPSGTDELIRNPGF